MNRPLILFINVLIIAACGLIYELLAGTLASYLLGDSVTQFSLVIGLYLSALGIGAWLSRYIGGDLAHRFVEVELGVALLGGFSAPLLFLSFSHVLHFQVMLYGVVLAVGILVGLEIPILMRLLKDQLEFKDLVSKVLTFDYIGALIASVLFPLWLVPHAGLVRTSLLFGLLNAGVSLWATELLRPLIVKGVWGLRVRGALVIVLLVAGLCYANRMTKWAEESLYPDRIVYTKTTPYQRIVVTSNRTGFNLFLNGHLQFSSADEYRYHEALVHPALILHGAPRRVLVLGGGDGLALREIFRHPTVSEVTLVDATVHAFPAAGRIERPLLQRPACHGGERRRLRLDAETRRAVRCRDRGLPRSQHVFSGQALHDAFLPHAPGTTRARRHRRRAVHLAARRAPQLLVRDPHARTGRLSRAAVPRHRAFVRRVGICTGQRRAVRTSRQGLLPSSFP
jgi:predicted membrane-bound spermidine synthase